VSRESMRAGMFTASAMWQAANSSGSRTSINKNGWGQGTGPIILTLTKNDKAISIKYFVLCGSNELARFAGGTNWATRWQRLVTLLFRNAVHAPAIAVLDKQSIQLRCFDTAVLLVPALQKLLGAWPNGLKIEQETQFATVRT
jgi:hypothetical protein